MMKLHQFFYPLLDIFFPAQCHSCQGLLKNSPVPFFCEACWTSIQPMKGPFCPQCGKPFFSSWALSFSPAHRCGDCRAKPPFFNRLMTPYPFEGVLSKGIFLYKYQQKISLVFPLVKLVLPYLELFRNIDLILPVPLHPGRLRQREFNQSLLLADEVGRFLKKPVLIDLLKKTKPTGPQMKLSRSERRKNLKNSFSVVNPEPIRNKIVLLMDDVFTTGSTMNECARMLKKGGCKEVVGLALARTLLRSRDTAV